MVKYQGFSTLEVLEGADNYNQWIAEKIRPHLTTPSLEIGSGIGNISHYLPDVRPLYLTDIDTEMVEKLKKMYAQEKDVITSELDITKTPPRNLQNKFASVFGVNVLEHIQDDKEALENIRLLLRDKGKLVLLVPAKKKAFTRLDKALGHYRRYEKKELQNLLESAEYKVDTITYFNFLGLFSWIARDRIGGKSGHLKRYQVASFDRIVPILKRVEAKREIPVGISLIVTAHKK